MGKKQHHDERLDVLFDVMNNENDLLLTDARGVALRVSDSYEEHYDVRVEDVIGKSCYELEGEGVFVPSVTAMVIKEKKKVTILQKNRRGESVLTTGVPLFDDKGELEYVISFNTIDIAGLSKLNDQYEALEKMLREYRRQLVNLEGNSPEPGALMTKSRQMQNIYNLIHQISDVDANVLITGETGVGKTFIANVMHALSHRKDGPFVTIDCGAIPPALLESELFGYEKGAFTGADQKGKPGKIELANGGTLLLDEIGSLPRELQVKLLSVIQHKKITRVGGLREINVDFRMIAATNQDLESSIRQGSFREDLYYRINVVNVRIPPLRERREDIIPLIMVFLDRFNGIYHKNISISPKALEALEQFSWPGNIRQLENCVERLVVTSPEEIVTEEGLPSDILAPRMWPVEGEGTLPEIMERVESRLIREAYEKYHTSIAVAQALGISQTTAARKLRKYVPEYTPEGR